MLCCLSVESGFVCRVRDFQGSINVAIAKQRPNLIKDMYRRPWLVNSDNVASSQASQDQVQPPSSIADASIAGHQMSGFVYMGARLNRNPEKPFHTPNKSYLAEENVPDMFLDASGSFEGTFMGSVIQGPSCAWYQTAQQADGESYHAMSNIADGTPS